MTELTCSLKIMTATKRLNVSAQRMQEVLQVTTASRHALRSDFSVSFLEIQDLERLVHFPELTVGKRPH